MRCMGLKLDRGYVTVFTSGDLQIPTHSYKKKIMPE